MSVHTILQRWSARPIALVEAPSFGAALELAAAHGVSLLYADLDAHARLAGGCRGPARCRRHPRRRRPAPTSPAPTPHRPGLVGHRPAGRPAAGADLRHADLREADLRHADLREARLRGADLRGAVFQGAKLDGACLDCALERPPAGTAARHPEAAREGSRAVARLAFAGDERPFAWLKTLLQEGLAAEWVLGVFADHILPGDNCAASLLRRLAADAVPSRPELPPIWTRPGPSNTPDVILRLCRTRPAAIDADSILEPRRKGPAVRGPAAEGEGLAEELHRLASHERESMTMLPSIAPQRLQTSATSPRLQPKPDPAGPSRTARRRPRNQASQRALAMLKLFPVAAATVPRIHIEKPASVEGLRIFDRPTGQRLVVYTPRFNSQFKAGHHSGRWYVRPVDDAGLEPLGPSFATAKAAVEAVASGRWSFTALLAERQGLRLRVIWPRRSTIEYVRAANAAPRSSRLPNRIIKALIIPWNERLR